MSKGFLSQVPKKVHTLTVYLEWGGGGLSPHKKQNWSFWFTTSIKKTCIIKTSASYVSLRLKKRRKHITNRRKTQVIVNFLPHWVSTFVNSYQTTWSLHRPTGETRKRWACIIKIPEQVQLLICIKFSKSSFSTRYVGAYSHTTTEVKREPEVWAPQNSNKSKWKETSSSKNTNNSTVRPGRPSMLLIEPQRPSEGNPRQEHSERRKYHIKLKEGYNQYC